MNKVSTVLIAALLLISNFSNAQSDPKAKAVLDKVSATLRTVKSLKADFTLALSKTKQKKSGTMYMKGAKYRVSIMGQEIFCDNRTISTYTKASNEVTINDMDPSENTLTPAKLFTNFYDKEFKTRYIGEKTVAGAKVVEIELVPTKPKNFVKVILQIDKVSNFIKSGNVYEKNGNIMSYAITKMSSNSVMPDTQFLFDAKKYPGVEVVDLR